MIKKFHEEKLKTLSVKYAFFSFFFPWFFDELIVGILVKRHAIFLYESLRIGGFDN